MSLADKMQLEGFAVQKTVSAETFQLMDGGETFTAILEPLPDIVTQMELGPDSREAARLHVLRTDCPEAILKEDATSQVRLKQLSSAAIWRIATRNDTPGDIEVKFTLVKKANHDF